jgi:hypothetical protein
VSRQGEHNTAHTRQKSKKHTTLIESKTARRCQGERKTSCLRFDQTFKKEIHKLSKMVTSKFLQDSVPTQSNIPTGTNNTS